jgi:hypothetical protein
MRRIGMALVVSLTSDPDHRYFICPAYPYFDPAYREYLDRPFARCANTATKHAA